LKNPHNPLSLRQKKKKGKGKLSERNANQGQKKRFKN